MKKIEKPKKKGYYWYTNKQKTNSWGEQIPAEPSIAFHNGDCELSITFIGNDTPYDLNELNDIQWYEGPIKFNKEEQ